MPQSDPSKVLIGEPVDANIDVGLALYEGQEADALDYVLGYTAANDVSSRTSQTNQSQWCFSKGFDTACPLDLYSAFSQVRHWTFVYRLTVCSGCVRSRRRIRVSHPRCVETADSWPEEPYCRAGLWFDVSRHGAFACFWLDTNAVHLGI